MKMPLYADPGAAGGDAQLLVVVAARAAAGEGVTQPVAVFRSDVISAVRPARGTLVRGDYQIGIAVIVGHHLGWAHHLRTYQIVGQVQQSPHERDIGAL